MEKRVRTRAAGRGSGYPPTCDKRKNQQRKRNNKCVLTSGGVSSAMTVTKLALHPRERARVLDVVDHRVHEEGPLRSRLVPLRVHEGGVHGPVQELLVGQDAVGELNCGSTQIKLSGPENGD